MKQNKKLRNPGKLPPPFPNGWYVIAEAQEVSIFVVHTDLYLQDLEDIRFGEFLISINEHLYRQGKNDISAIKHSLRVTRILKEFSYNL